VWWDTAKIAWRTRKWSDKLAVWFKAPAWTPSDIEQHKKPDPQYPKFDPPATKFTKTYTFVQYWLLLAAALWLQKAEPDLPRAFVIAMFLWICFAFYVQGVWLEGRESAMRLEWWRIAGAVAVAGAGFVLWPHQLDDIAKVMLVYATACVTAAGIAGLRRTRPTL
jgi:hypothetical protein